MRFSESGWIDSELDGKYGFSAMMGRCEAKSDAFCTALDAVFEDCTYDRDPLTGAMAGAKGSSMQERAESLVTLSNCCGVCSHKLHAPMGAFRSLSLSQWLCWL